MKDIKEGQFPECDKWGKAVDEKGGKTLLDFLDWIQNSLGIQLAKYGEHDKLWPISERSENLVFEYFDVDPKKLEAERRELLKSLR